jgi:hypothetical protein
VKTKECWARYGSPYVGFQKYISNKPEHLYTCRFKFIKTNYVLTRIRVILTVRGSLRNNLSAQPRQTVWKYCKIAESRNSPPCCAGLACISIVHGVGSSVIFRVLCQKFWEHNVSFIPAHIHITCTRLQVLKYTNRHYVRMRYFITWFSKRGRWE